MATPRISQNEVCVSSGSGFRQMPRFRRLNPQVPQLSGPPCGIGALLCKCVSDAPALYQKSDCGGNRPPCTLLPEGTNLFYSGETVRLLRELPERALPQFKEGTVSGVALAGEDEDRTVEVVFYQNGK